MRDSSLWSFQAELEGDYYKSLAQVPTKELQERLYELQNEHEMIGRVLGARSDVTKVEIPPGNGNVEGCDLRKVEYGKGKFAVRAAEHPHVARCLQVKGLAPANIQTCYHIIADFNSYPQWMPWCTSARVDGSAKTSPLQFQCAVGFGIKHGGPTISDVVTYNVTLKPPDGKAAGIVAASEPFSYCETLVYDWTFEAKEKSTQVTVNVYFKAKTFLLLPIWEALQRSLIEGIMDAFAEEIVSHERGASHSSEETEEYSSESQQGPHR